MCGISGQISWRGSDCTEPVKSMIRHLCHRGPDDSGVWKSSDNYCTLGHVRLSIIDLSPLGHQPMLDPLTGNAIVFNGEIYNFQELRAQCEKQGDHFLSQSDTEVILALYRRYGIDCLNHLRGMFAFALWDSKSQHLFLARDRIGKKPLNYSLSRDSLVFASELDALVHHPEVDALMDLEALDLYLQLQYIPAPWTIYRGIRKLPPAHYAIFSREGIKVSQYWDVDYTAKVSLTEQEALDGLEETLRDAVRLRMISDVPLGALLSGGVDSSVIVAIMAGLSKEPVKTFSIGFEEESLNELPYAAMVANRYATTHCPEVVSGDVAPLLDTIVRHYGEPYADSSAIPSFLVCRTARQHVTVAMNGDGGDELLGGYPRYSLTSQSIALGSMLGNFHSPARLAEMVVGLEKVTSFWGRVRRKWLLRVAHPEIQSLIMYAAFWNEKERAELLGRDIIASSLMSSWRTDWLDQARHAADNPIDRMLWIDNRTYLPGDLLVKMDIASMHCGLETRSPLLDHKVIEYCASLPVNLKVNNRHGKYLLKKLAERYLPRELIYRPKMGFGIPLASWLRGPLQLLVKDILTDSEAMAPLRQDVTRRTLVEFMEQGIDHSSRIWALLMFGLWHRYYKALK